MLLHVFPRFLSIIHGTLMLISYSLYHLSNVNLANAPLSKVLPDLSGMLPHPPTDLMECLVPEMAPLKVIDSKQRLHLLLEFLRLIPASLAGSPDDFAHQFHVLLTKKYNH